MTDERLPPLHGGVGGTWRASLCPLVSFPCRQESAVLFPIYFYREGGQNHDVSGPEIRSEATLAEKEMEVYHLTC